jgi:hypothetical protein
VFVVIVEAESLSRLVSTTGPHHSQDWTVSVTGADSLKRCLEEAEKSRDAYIASSERCMNIEIQAKSGKRIAEIFAEMQEKNNAKMAEMQQNIMQTRMEIIERLFKLNGKKSDNCD